MQITGYKWILPILESDETNKTLAKRYHIPKTAVAKIREMYTPVYGVLKMRLEEGKFATKDTLYDWCCRWMINGLDGETTGESLAFAFGISSIFTRPFLDYATYRIPIYEDGRRNKLLFGIRKDSLDSAVFSEYNLYLEDIENRKKPRLVRWMED